MIGVFALKCSRYGCWLNKNKPLQLIMNNNNELIKIMLGCGQHGKYMNHSELSVK